MELANFSIPTFRKEQIRKRLEKLVKKAAKYGNGDISFSFGGTKIVTIKTEYGYRDYEFIDVTVSGDAPQIEGWQLLARVELTGQDENLIHSVPGSETVADTKYRTHNGHCDHCNSLRQRNDVYVLSDGAEQIAVGRTCLRDFLGIDDPKSIVNRAQFFEEIKSIEEEDLMDGFSSLGYFHLPEVLRLSAAYIRKNGYVSKTKQQETGFATTGDCVAYCISGIPGYEIEVEDVDEEWATKTVEFFRGTDFFGNDYMDNIRVIMKQDILKKQHIGLVASSVITAQRELAPKTEVKESNFVGEVKQRLKGLDLVLDKVIYLGNGAYGPSFLHLMSDTSGNQFSWVTGNKIELAEGSKVKLDATVKQHKTYNGTKQTVLTRAKQLEKVDDDAKI